MAQVCRGEAPPELEPATAGRVARLLPSIVSLTRREHLGKETAFLENYRGPFTKYRYEDSFDFGSEGAREAEELGRLPGINCLGFHPELLADRRMPAVGTIAEPMVEEEAKEEGDSEMEGSDDGQEVDE